MENELKQLIIDALDLEDISVDAHYFKRYYRNVNRALSFSCLFWHQLLEPWKMAGILIVLLVIKLAINYSDNHWSKPLLIAVCCIVDLPFGVIILLAYGFIRPWLMA